MKKSVSTIALAGGLCLLVASPAAAAVNVFRDAGNVLQINAGAANDSISIDDNGTSLFLVRSTDPITAGAGCTAPQLISGQSQTNCDRAGLTAIDADLGDGGDIWADLRPSNTPAATVRAGASNDFVGGLGVFDGGAGTDRYAISQGLPNEAPENRDAIIVDESASQTIIRVPSGNGGAFTRATLTSFEHFLATLGDDVLNGAAAPSGRNYAGRSGTDSIIGSAFNDSLFGENGADIMLGGDGNDVIDAKAGEFVAVPDIRINCGEGTADFASIDLTDPEPEGGCETVNRSAIGERPHVRMKAPRIARRRAGASTTRNRPAAALAAVLVRMRCPAAVRHPCRGALRLGFRPSGIGRSKATRYAIAAGKSDTVRIMLAGRRARLARRGKPVFLRSIEVGDVRGFKTSTSLRTLR